MIIVIKRGIIFFALGLIIILITMAYVNQSTPAASFNHENRRCIIIDPGHGIPDGGAVSNSGITESPINLKIALKLEEELTERGFTVVMTRRDENGLSKKKKTDMNMRLECYNACGYYRMWLFIKFRRGKTPYG